MVDRFGHVVRPEPAGHDDRHVDLLDDAAVNFPVVGKTGCADTVGAVGVGHQKVGNALVALGQLNGFRAGDGHALQQLDARHGGSQPGGEILRGEYDIVAQVQHVRAQLLGQLDGLVLIVHHNDRRADGAVPDCGKHGLGLLQRDAGRAEVITDQQADVVDARSDAVQRFLGSLNGIYRSVHVSLPRNFNTDLPSEYRRKKKRAENTINAAQQGIAYRATRRAGDRLHSYVQYTAFSCRCQARRRGEARVLGRHMVQRKKLAGKLAQN